MRIDQRITIEAPASLVWEIALNASRRTEWDYRIVESELLTRGPLGKGTRGRLAGSIGMRFSMQYEYVQFDPIRRCSVKFTDIKGMPVASGGGGWTFTDLGANRCQFATKGQFQLAKMPLAGLIGRLFLGPMVRWMTRKSLRRLKRLAEAEWTQKQESQQVAARI